MMEILNTRTQSISYLRYKERAVSERLNLLHVERVKYPLVFGPGDELEWRLGLYVTVDDPAEMKGQILDGRGKHHAGRV